MKQEGREGEREGEKEKEGELIRIDEKVEENGVDKYN